MQPQVQMSSFGIPGGSGPRTIVSVYPKPMRQELRHEGFKQYELAAAEKGSYTKLVVTDTFAWCRDFSADELKLYPAPVPAQIVADNLIQRWTTGMVGAKDGLGPGIAICAGAEPTEEEIALLTARQEEYFRNLIYEGDALYQAGDKNNQPTDLHRMAANWMGANDRPWVKRISNTKTRNCPECYEEIMAQARICKHCHSKIEPEVEAAVEEPVKSKGKRKATKEPDATQEPDAE